VTARYNFRVRAGNSGSVENEAGLEAIITTGGVPVDMTGDTIVFRVLAAGVQVLRKTNPAILVDIPTARITVPLTTADSRTLEAAGGRLNYDLERRTVAGGQRTLLCGEVFVEPGANDD